MGLAKALTHTRDGATTSGGQVSDYMQLPGTWCALKQQAMHDVTNGKTTALTHSSTKGMHGATNDKTTELTRSSTKGHQR